MSYERINYGEAILSLINGFVKRKAIKMTPFEIPDVQGDYNSNTQRKRSKTFEAFSLAEEVQNNYEDDDFSVLDRNFDNGKTDRNRNSQHFVSQANEPSSSKYFVGKNVSDSAQKQKESLERDIEELINQGFDFDDF